MWRRCLDILAQGIDSDGRPSAIVPTDVPSSLYGQAMHLPMSIREYYMATGDRSLIVDTADALRRYLAYCESNMTREDLFVAPSWSWHWVDWAPLDHRAYSLPVNALLVMACMDAERLAGVIGDRALATVASRIAARVRRAIAAFYDNKAGAFRSHIEPRTKLDIPPLKPNSLTSELAKTLTHNVHGNVLAAVAGCGTAAREAVGACARGGAFRAGRRARQRDRHGLRGHTPVAALRRPGTARPR